MTLSFHDLNLFLQLRVDGVKLETRLRLAPPQLITCVNDRFRNLETCTNSRQAALYCSSSLLRCCNSFAVAEFGNLCICNGSDLGLPGSEHVASLNLVNSTSNRTNLFMHHRVGFLFFHLENQVVLCLLVNYLNQLICNHQM